MNNTTTHTSGICRFCNYLSYYYTFLSFQTVSPCFEGPIADPVVCMNTGGGFLCDGCPPGYNGDGITCTDIDEVRNSAEWLK